MSSSTPASSTPAAAALRPGPVRPRRYKAAIACTTCRRRKLKCDGARPACSRCQKEPELRDTCTYIPTSETRASPLSYSAQNAASSAALPTPAASTSCKSEPQDATDTRAAFSDGGPGPFASKVTAAIDAKLGLPSEKKQGPTPLLDAPLFGALDPRQPSDAAFNQAENVLPPRKHADLLLGLHWRHLESIEPVLDHDRFYHSYQALFAGGDVGCDERVFVSTLNVVFALSTQLQESLPPVQRDEASRTFFLRAWCLLRPETVIWESGSLELVQCLLLMSRYLQCTSNLHQTWMALGSAVRIAQSLGFHVPEKPLHGGGGGDKTARLKRELWQQCVYMDRSLSWSLGRPLAVPLVTPFPPLRYSSHAAHISNKLLELDDITSHILMLQTFANSSFAENLGLPQSRADMNAATHFDDRLTKLSASFEAVPEDAGDSSAKRRIVFRLRLAHTRILLFRPMLARFCLAHTLADRAPAPADAPLGDRVLQACAARCVESTERLIALVADGHRASVDAGASVLPWWYRVFYLYVASQHLVAAMMRPDVFAPAVTEAWGTAAAALAAHEHLSPAVRSCVANFQKMWQKVTDLCGPGPDQAPPLEGPSDADFQDIFQHLEFGQENPLFDMENSAWLDSVDWNV